MCGIVGAIAKRDIQSVLINGLKTLEYRGYDSAGIAVLESLNDQIQRLRIVGKVAKLTEVLEKEPMPGQTGIAHTRWATHGQPNETNAHPHMTHDTIAVVHNGIIENHEQLRTHLISAGYVFESETDTEVIGHLIHHHLQKTKDMLQAIQHTCDAMIGAFALGIICAHEPNHLYAARRGSPLVIGIGKGENFIASDQIALLKETQDFMYLEEGDIAQISHDKVFVQDIQGKIVQREIHHSTNNHNEINKGTYQHFMIKEIFEQPSALRETLTSHIINDHIVKQSFGHKADQIFNQIKRVQIVACGTSFHAGLVARHWIETLAHVPCQVEIASEYRYRESVVEPGSLFVTISQSGETADSLAALRRAKEIGHIASLGICNVAESSLAREADLLFLTQAGAEIGVAATKTFTSQLVALFMLALILGQENKVPAETIDKLTKDLQSLPTMIESILALDASIQEISKELLDKDHALFLGRGEHHAIAMEGALKLKEISYMHAEAYAAGELKHGPLALVDPSMPVFVIAPKNTLIEKLQSNVQEVSARGGELYVFADETLHWPASEHVHVINMPSVPESLTPLAYTIPLQLLSYYVGVLKGTDVDQPRNLAKSVTVE